MANKEIEIDRCEKCKSKMENKGEVAVAFNTYYKTHSYSGLWQCPKCKNIELIPIG